MDRGSVICLTLLVFLSFVVVDDVSAGNQTNAENITLMRLQANFSEAKLFFIVPDCYNATDRALNAKGLSELLLSQAIEEEGGMPGNMRLKTMRYTAIVNETEALLARIVYECDGHGDGGKMSDGYYFKALEYLKKDNLTLALAFVRQARDRYAGEKNDAGASKCDILLEEIKSRTKIVTSSTTTTQTSSMRSVTDLPKHNNPVSDYAPYIVLVVVLLLASVVGYMYSKR